MLYDRSFPDTTAFTNIKKWEKRIKLKNKELIKFNIQKTNNPIKNGQKT